MCIKWLFELNEKSIKIDDESKFVIYVKYK